MKQMIWLTTFTILFIVFVVPGVLALKLSMTPASDQPGYSSDHRASIYGKRQISQKFMSREINLTAIGTSIKNPNLKNKKEIALNLYDGTNNLIRTSFLNGRNVQDGGFVKFVFEPILDSQNKTYSFTLSSPDAGPEDEIEVFLISSSTESVLEYTYDNITYSGGIPLVTFHKPDSKWQIMKTIYSNLFSRLLSPGFQRI